MIFGGFQPFTLSDYPSCIAAIAFSQGCNFRCRFCHNGSLLPMVSQRGQSFSSDEVLARMSHRVGKLEGLVVSGGEPTIHSDLPEFLGQIKGMGFKVKLDTNGSRPVMLAEVLRLGLVDYIAMDVKASLPLYPRMCGVPIATEIILESIGLIAASGVAHHFRTTFSKQLMPSSDLECIKAIIPEQSEHVTQEFQPRYALDPELRPTDCAI